MPSRIDNIKTFLKAAKAGNRALVFDMLEQKLVNVNDILSEDFDGIAANTNACMLAAGNGHLGLLRDFSHMKYPVDYQACNSQGKNAFDFVMTGVRGEDWAAARSDQLAQLVMTHTLDLPVNVDLNFKGYSAEKKRETAASLGISDLENTPYLVYAAERGMLNTALNLIDLGVPVSKKHAPSLRVHGMPETCDALEVAIINDHLPLVKALANITFVHDAIKLTRALTIDNPVELGPEHMLLAARFASLPLFEVMCRIQGQSASIFDLLLQVLRRKIAVVDNMGQQKMLGNGDATVAKFLLRYINPETLSMEQKDAILSAALEGCPVTGWFMRELLKHLQLSAQHKDSEGKTLMERAVNAGAVGAIPVLFQMSESLAGLSIDSIVFQEFSFKFLEDTSGTEHVFTTSLLGFSALCHQMPLMEALMKLDAQVYPQNIRQEQLDKVVTQNQWKNVTLINFMQERRAEYSEVLKFLMQNNMQISRNGNSVRISQQASSLPPSRSQTPEPMTGNRGRRHSVEPAPKSSGRRSIFSLVSCIRLPNSEQSTVTTNSRAATPQNLANREESGSPITGDVTNPPPSLQHAFRLLRTRRTSDSDMQTPQIEQRSNPSANPGANQLTLT